MEEAVFKYYRFELEQFEESVFYKISINNSIRVVYHRMDEKFGVENVGNYSLISKSTEITEQEFNEVFVKAMISLGFADAYKLIIPTLENAVTEYIKTKQN